MAPITIDTLCFYPVDADFDPCRDAEAATFFSVEDDQGERLLDGGSANGETVRALASNKDSTNLIGLFVEHFESRGYTSGKAEIQSGFHRLISL
jgi:hypothetical protein